MRIFIFLLLVSLVVGDEYDGPSDGCKSNPSTCKESDFLYRTNEPQCLYTNYDRRFEPWKLPINDTFREDCPIWLSCQVMPRDKSILEFLREVSVGNDNDIISKIKQNARVYDSVPVDVRPQANRYYNRDVCQIGMATYISGAVVFVLLLIACVCGCVAYCDMVKTAGLFNRMVGYGIVREPPPQVKRSRRVF